jgi:hypothetical protein
MKKIYFVLTYTGTILSRIVHIYTRQEFCHSSLSLDAELNEMYSFGRYWAYNPFIGGFIKEEVDSGTFKRFRNTEAAIYSLEVTDWQYKRIKREIKRMKNSKDKYTFNTLGLAAILFDKKLTRKNKYYCSEFVKHLVEVGKVENNLPDIVRPQDFENIDNVELIYKGKLN